MSESCIFCRIARGEIPSTRLYEDEVALAFLDIGPLVKGHALVIPRQHVDPLMDAPEDLLARLIAVVRRVARAQVKALQADGVNVHQSNGRVAGQVIPHLHFHVVPRFEGDGLSWNWTPRPYTDPHEAQRLALNIRAAMEP